MKPTDSWMPEVCWTKHARDVHLNIHQEEITRIAPGFQRRHFLPPLAENEGAVAVAGCVVYGYLFHCEQSHSPSFVRALVGSRDYRPPIYVSGDVHSRPHPLVSMLLASHQGSEQDRRMKRVPSPERNEDNTTKTSKGDRKAGLSGKTSLTNTLTTASSRCEQREYIITMSRRLVLRRSRYSWIGTCTGGSSPSPDNSRL
ncbi:hypothetical protein KQX54_007478 [Cotesia glomerata]|uniref:Uncharacterized protein n=1 Tax=Cotesia glomerata TaxID=32391 RepID=A0AAV7I819_COTGL|nr:hypothetical protein KQX54_007478 [Cotesia glomerata]